VLEADHDVEHELDILHRSVGSKASLIEEDESSAQLLQTIRAEVASLASVPCDALVPQQLSSEPTSTAGNDDDDSDSESDDDESFGHYRSLAMMIDEQEQDAVLLTPDHELLIKTRHAREQAAQHLAQALTPLEHWHAILELEQCRRTIKQYERDQNEKFQQLQAQMADIRGGIQQEINSVVGDVAQRFHRLNIVKPGLAAMDTLMIVNNNNNNNNNNSRSSNRTSKTKKNKLPPRIIIRRPHTTPAPVPSSDGSWQQTEKQLWATEAQTRQELISMAKAYVRQDKTGRLAQRYGTDGSETPALCNASNDSLFNWESECSRILDDDSAYVLV
jgi:hypothetical protein